jgi:2-polyprenyl-3-methyl-5-hydroxy-6-metoxy-1,4-benzoquinol methylase
MFRERGGVAETIVQYQFVLDHLKNIKGRCVLDVGIGPNPSLWYMLNSTGFYCHGFDIKNRVDSKRFSQIDITKAHQLHPTFFGVFCLDVLHSIRDADRAVINMIKATSAGGVIFIAVPYNLFRQFDAGNGTRVYSEKDINRWCNMIGDVIDKKYWRVWEGSYWRQKSRLLFPIECGRAKKAADMVAIAVRVPEPPARIKDDMARCNYKLDDGWNRYYGEGWKDFKVRTDWIVNNVTKGPVLDLGCGPGVICNELRKKKLLCIGVDYSDKIIRIAKSRGGEFLWGSAEDIPCEDNFFNTVVVTETLEHVNDLEQSLKEIDRVLKPDGDIIITVPDGGTTSRVHLRTFIPEDFKNLPWNVDFVGKYKEWILVKCKK